MLGLSLQGVWAGTRGLSRLFARLVVFAQGLLRRRRSRQIAAALALVLVVWWRQIPVVRIAYGAVVYPVRGIQFYFSPDRPDAERLSFLAGLSSGRGGMLAHLDSVGLWAVLRALRTEQLSLPQQAIALAIVQQESMFRFYVKNKRSSACGLFQLIDATSKAKKMPWWRCMDPVANTRAGVAFFRQVSARSPADLAAAARCAYLRHYYGPAHSCAADARGIWNKVGARMTGRTIVYLKALRRLQTEQERRGFFGRLFRAVYPFLPLMLMGVCAAGVMAARGIRRR